MPATRTDRTDNVARTVESDFISVGEIEMGYRCIAGGRLDLEPYDDRPANRPQAAERGMPGHPAHTSVATLTSAHGQKARASAAGGNSTALQS